MHRAFRLFVSGLALPLALVSLAATTVPNEIEQPGTQPLEVAAFSSSCGCHYGTDNPQVEPGFGWEGGMMANAGRDPLFWATLAIAEQDFLPNADPTQRGGAGDLCIRCHSVGGWLAGRSTPTDGSGLASTDDRGVECEFCHLLVDPDPPTNVVGTVEEQHAPFEAYDPVTGERYSGSGQYVLNSEGTRLGPYAEGDEQANHAAFGSTFHRQAELCGTCHDVSNPAVGDLAHNHGAQENLLAPGSFSGVPGAPIESKAAFNNPPYAYGIVERTYSEWKASAWPEARVNDFAGLPQDLRVAGGAVDVAYERAWSARRDADYADGSPRYFTCQTCHMYASTGKGCDKNNAPVRTDLPQHDHMGGGYWMSDVIRYQDANGTLRFGTGLTSFQIDAMTDAKQRAADQLTRAAALASTQVGQHLQVRVTNLTGHKLISGYPEGRRFWISVKWFDAAGAEMPAFEHGAYGAIGRTITDLSGGTHQVQSLLDLDAEGIYEAQPGMDQPWAQQLSDLGYPDSFVLTYDRLTDQPDDTLGDLRVAKSDGMEHTFHFVLNNVMVQDNRIPPYGMRYDDAVTRNILPVPKSRFGAPAPGGVFDHWDDVLIEVPPGAARADVRLFYQQTSWEYVQFLWLANDTLGPFLGQEGVRLLDAWANTGMSPPFEMNFAQADIDAVVPAVPGEAAAQDSPDDWMRAVGFDPVSETLSVSYGPACDAVDHNVYYGDLASVGAYGYTGAECSIGTGGVAGFTAQGDAMFFLIVANDGSEEGSYGRSSLGVERPEDVGTLGCDRIQNLADVVCE